MKVTLREKIYKKYPLSLAEGILGGIIALVIIMSLRIVQPMEKLPSEWAYYLCAAAIISLSVWIFIRLILLQRRDYKQSRYGLKKSRQLKYLIWLPAVLAVSAFFLSAGLRFVLILIALWILIFIKMLWVDVIIYFSKDGYFLLFDQIQFEGLKIQEIRKIKESGVYQFRFIKDKEVIGWNSLQEEDYDYLLTKIRRVKK